MFESLSDKLFARREFVHPLGRGTAGGFGPIVASPANGLSGYHGLGGLSRIGEFLNEAMILSGMGPVSPLTGSASKYSAGCYAICCGLALRATTGVLLAPVIQRSQHKFHLAFDRNK